MKRAAMFLAISMAGSVSAASGAPGGPAASPAARPAVPAASQSVDLVERRLFSDAIEASSFLWNDWNRFQENYHPNYVGDDDARTGWVEGHESSGAGEWLRVAVTPLDGTSAVRLKIRNGYQKSATLFRANARAKAITVKVLPSGKSAKATLQDKQGWQEIVVSQEAGPLRAVELTVDSVYEGSKYADLVISDVQVFATSTTRDNPAFEKSKRDGLLAWRKARMAAAKLFKAGKGAELPLYSSYRVMDRELSSAAISARKAHGVLAAAAAEPGFAEWREAIKLATELRRNQDAMTPAQIAPSDSTELPEVDGFELQDLGEAFEGILQDHALRLPMLGHASAFFSDKLRVLDQKGDKPSDYEQGVYITSRCKPAAWVKRVKATEASAPDRVAALLVAQCGQVPSREGTSMAIIQQLMVFGKDGRLVLVVGDGYVDGYRWEDSGKIAGGRSIQYDTSVELVKAQVAAK